MIRRHRAALAVLGSLVFHALLLTWLVKHRSEPAPRRPAPTWMTVQLRPIPFKPSQQHAPVVRVPGHRSSAGAVASKPSSVSSEGGKRAPGADAPIAHNLMPRLPQGSAEGPGVPVPQHGQTLRNDGVEPDQKAVAAYNAERAQRKVQGWALESLAEGRAQRGLVSPYFNDLKKSLESLFSAAPPALSSKDYENMGKGAAQAGWGEYADQLQRYGASGNPLESRDPDVEEVQTRYSPSAQALMRDPGATVGPWGSSPSAQIGGALAQMEPARRMAERAADQFKLSAVVELLQARDGRVRQAKLMKTSGSKAFDDGVLAIAPKAAAKLPAPSGPGLGTNGDEIRSLWEFQGRLHFKKKVSDMVRAEDKKDLALGALTSLATGSVSFDETRGSVELLDVTHPTLELKAKLLKLY